MYEYDPAFEADIRAKYVDRLSPADINVLTTWLRQERIYNWDLFKKAVEALRNSNRFTKLPFGLVAIIIE